MPHHDAPEHARGATTLLAVLNAMRQNGFPREMTVRPGGQITCGECGETTDASEFTVRKVRRLEGASDPADMALVAGVACPSCAGAGPVVVRYGAEADEDDDALLQRLDLPEAS